MLSGGYGTVAGSDKLILDRGSSRVLTDSQLDPPAQVQWNLLIFQQYVLEQQKVFHFSANGIAGHHLCTVYLVVYAFFQNFFLFLGQAFVEHGFLRKRRLRICKKWQWLLTELFVIMWICAELTKDLVTTELLAKVTAARSTCHICHCQQHGSKRKCEDAKGKVDNGLDRP